MRYVATHTRNEGSMKIAIYGFGAIGCEVSASTRDNTLAA